MQSIFRKLWALQDDGVQDMLSQKRAPMQHMEYFQPKELEKWYVQDGLFDLSSKADRSQANLAGLGKPLENVEKCKEQLENLTSTIDILSLL